MIFQEDRTQEPGIQYMTFNLVHVTNGGLDQTVQIGHIAHGHIRRISAPLAIHVLHQLGLFLLMLLKRQLP